MYNYTGIRQVTTPAGTLSLQLLGQAAMNQKILSQPVPSRVKDVTGQKYGMLCVVSYAGKKSRHQWNCLCECGTVKAISGFNLQSGSVKSCGCNRYKHLEAVHEGNRKHELVDGKPAKQHELFNTWKSMVARCHNPKHVDYSRYGSRGIKVCAEWRNSFKQFVTDMGKRPNGRTIDRINNDDCYCLSNCRWATSKTQGRNKRSTKLNPAIVKSIRALREKRYTIPRIKKELNLKCSTTTISAAARGLSWPDV